MAPAQMLAFLERVRALLSPEGLLVLTAPYGTREVTELERIYDEESLTELLAGWEILERRIAVRRDPLSGRPPRTSSRGRAASSW